MFVKHQKQTINGKEYEYYYLYESYYHPGMKNPTNFKVGKVGEDASTLISNLKEKAEEKDINLDQDDIDHFKIQLNTVEAKAKEEGIEEDELGEFYDEAFSGEPGEDEGSEAPKSVGNWKRKKNKEERIRYENEESDDEPLVISNSQGVWEVSTPTEGLSAFESSTEKSEAIDKAVNWMENNQEVEISESGNKNFCPEGARNLHGEGFCVVHADVDPVGIEDAEEVYRDSLDDIHPDIPKDLKEKAVDMAKAGAENSVFDTEPFTDEKMKKVDGMIRLYNFIEENQPVNSAFVSEDDFKKTYITEELLEDSFMVLEMDEFIENPEHNTYVTKGYDGDLNPTNIPEDKKETDLEVVQDEIVDILSMFYEDGRDKVSRNEIKVKVAQRLGWSLTDSQDERIEEAFEKLSTMGITYQPEPDMVALVSPEEENDLESPEDEGSEGQVRFAYRDAEMFLDEDEVYLVEWKNSGEMWNERDSSPYPAKADEIKESFENADTLNIVDGYIKWTNWGSGRLPSKKYRIDPDNTGTEKEYEEYKQKQKEKAREEFEEDLEKLRDPDGYNPSESILVSEGSRAGIPEEEVKSRVEEAKEESREEEERRLKKAKRNVKNGRDNKLVKKYFKVFDADTAENQVSDLRGMSEEDWDRFSSKIKNFDGAMFPDDNMVTAIMYDDDGISSSEVKDFYDGDYEEFSGWKKIEREDEDDVYVPDSDNFDEDDASFSPEYVEKIDKLFEEGYSLYFDSSKPLMVLPDNSSKVALTVAPRIST